MKTPKIVVITGATGGLGSALVRLHLDKGDTVIATGRTHERLNQLAEQLGTPLLSPVTLSMWPIRKAARNWPIG
ncbi:SDR family NAD(P)-dependent oxidoreductase [Brevibacillus composti]|uniref:SDR family NAD(P)-dependent oxidoreductase n=1 Tax=Brevibacillus composti TaxID=2796470 RepID=UPI00226B1EF7|nr:SDR family NAD(P)-dependent oxidoreductase [Brevibacillus composti]